MSSKIKKAGQKINEKFKAMPRTLRGTSLSLIATVLLVILFDIFSKPIGISLNLATEFLIGFFIFLLITFVWLVSTFLRYRGCFDPILKSTDNPLFPHLKTQIQNIYKTTIEEVGGGAEVYPENMESINKALFQSGEGEYIGVESTLPSTFFEKYPTYLDYHEKYLEENENKGARILIAEGQEAIYDDSRIHMEPYQKFISWHKNNGVKVLWIDQETANKIKSEVGMETTDVGVWKDSFAVLFSPNDGYVEVKLAEKEKSEFEKASSYVNRILEEANKLKLEFPLISQNLVNCWPDFIGEPTKRNKTIGKVLLDELEEYQNYKGRILDAAAGMGHDGLFLIQNQFDVVFNEVDPEFQNKLKEELDRKGIKAKVFGSDWRVISKNIDSLYQAVLVLGNSLCMVRDKEERKNCIEEFYDILAPGGKLIIDERNFPKIEDEIKQKGEYKRRNKIMYKGDYVDFKATKKEDLFSFNFYRTTDGSPLGNIYTAKLEKDELKNMLLDTGFEIEKEYSDLKEGHEDDAEFYTYVAVKPSES